MVPFRQCRIAPFLTIVVFFWACIAAISPAHAQADEIDEGIRITSATLGEECGARPGNLTWPLVQQCDGKKFCRFPLTQDMVDTATVDAERCASRVAIRWRCANRPETFEELSPRRANPPGVEAGYITLISCPPEAADEIKLPAAKLRSVQISDRPALNRELGSVRIMRGNIRVDTEVGMDLLIGDLISTGTNTKALINYPDTADVTLEPNTRVRISSIFLEAGTVIADVVNDILGIFKVETEYVTAGAKGTVFRVTVDPKKEEATINVAEGFVEWEPKDRAWDDALLKPGETRIISAEADAPTEIERTPNIIRAILEEAEKTKETAVCDENAGDPAYNGEILKKVGSGPNFINARAGDGDAFIKLKNRSGNTILSFYVKANSSAKIENLPDGNFSVSWATGQRFSRGCGIFFEDMSASAAEGEVRLVSTRSNYTGYELSLRRVRGGNMQSRDLPLGTFLRD